MKLSAISLIFKKEERNQIRNYRPISLSNNDIKLLTKVMSERLKKYMGIIIGKDQFACPDRNITTPIHIMRDIFCDAVKHQHEHFIISVDFIKAFDSVDRNFMISVLERLGFQGFFLETIKNLNSATGAKLIINGFISKTVKLRRGIKQGDALSLFLFLVALEPLIIAINNNPIFKGIKTPGGTEQKSLCYADDLNLTFRTRDSLHPLMKLIDEFGSATGLRVQPSGHQKCCTCLVTAPALDLDLSQLPNNLKYLHKGIEILGTAIGNEDFIEQFTGKKVKIFETEAKRLREYTQTYNERKILANYKLLPLASFHTQFHGISNQSKNKIDTISKTFTLKHTATKKQYYKATRAPENGGFGLPHIVKNAECLILKQIFKYAHYRSENIPLDVEMSFVESNIGHFISRLCDFQIVNIRHTYPPNYFYHRVKEFIDFYQISKEEILTGLVKPIRDRIRNGTTKPTHSNRWAPTPFREFPCVSPRETLNSIHSHKIMTFNYKMQNKLLPFPSLRELWGLPGASANCTFCDQHRESEPHLFYYCDQILHLWNNLGNITGKQFEYSEVVNLEFSDNLQNRLSRIFLVSTTNFKIWSHRNAIKFGTQTRFSLVAIIKDLYYTLQENLEFENRRPREPFKTELLDLLQNFNQFMVQARLLPDEGIT